MTQSQRVLSQLWFLTAIHVDMSTLRRHPKGEIKVEKFTRTFGYKWGYPQAIEAVMENHGNMHECLYNYLVMERIGEGVHSLAKDEVWFKWSVRKQAWKPCKKPNWSNGMVNWALG